jgi:hypothetical protein
MMTPPRFILIYDLPADPDNPGGPTIKEVNLAIQHSIPIRALVEITDSDFDDSAAGVWMYVVHHTRDCDGTLLYCLSHDRYDRTRPNPRMLCGERTRWIGGYSETDLRVVSTTPGREEGREALP